MVVASVKNADMINAGGLSISIILIHQKKTLEYLNQGLDLRK
jgi:hypothetical protein